ncbi:MAG: hypothetical protein ACREDV_09730, partial [Methylocella sp.]
MPDFVIRLTADIIGEPGRNARTALPAEAIRMLLVEQGPINRLGERHLSAPGQLMIRTPEHDHLAYDESRYDDDHGRDRRHPGRAHS